ncbi:multidrug ABC transporter ATP-binding protein [Pilimelia terevasa]|uniref:Multidrug ABC transporter ATP-binding protein n=1 Tax=Pilimelia terevasa TaxID=53372 RepID=A0A8J3FGQ0_9ACTN|nr:ABC transporter ATP-binding protein [Pilimelia terevasa]GGK22965.1 multidrug ABC transporter ATP-binding protein [Pilimelia terevasa]
MTARTDRRIIWRGLRVLGRAVAEQPRLFTVGVLGSVVYSLLIIGGAYLSGYVVGHVVVPAVRSGSVATGTLAAAGAAFVAVTLLRIAGIFGRRLGAGYMQFQMQARYRRRVTRRYLSLPLSWHHRHSTGTLLSNANSDVEAAWFPIAPLPFAVGTVVMLVAALGSLLATDWVLALVGFGVFPTLFGVNVVYSRRMAPRQARAQQLRGEVSDIAHESFDGALVVKAMGREAAETARFRERAGQLRDALISVGRLRGAFDPVLEVLPTLGTLTALLVGAWRLRAGAIGVEELVSVTLLFTVLAFPVRAIGWVLSELPRSVAGWDRVRSVLAATGEMPYGAAAAAGGAGAALAFEDVTFAYTPGLPVLRDVTFTVPAGRTVALVGPTGAGKSTLAALAARLVDPTAGVVRLDGADLRGLRADALAAAVALVPQTPFVFDDSVRANVALERPGVDEAAVRAALDLAQATAFVDHLPAGPDTELGERGATLSGGQRQRLTLARALAGRPRLLVVDDATSAVDPRVEAAILAGLRGRAPAATILVVAYRRATITLADEVVYLDGGTVRGRGTHADLLRTVPGYAALVSAYEQADAERTQAHAYDEDPAYSGEPA